MIILFGASASGKTEVAKNIQKKYSFKKVITSTTRPIRINEVNGKDYFFFTKEEFLKMKEENKFVETAEYNNYYYGSLKSEIADDKVIILEPQGVHEYLKFNDPHLVFFYLECSEDERIKRMKLRGDSNENIEKRIKNDRISFNEKNLPLPNFVLNTEHISVDDLTDIIYYLYHQFLNK